MKDIGTPPTPLFSATWRAEPFVYNTGTCTNNPAVWFCVVSFQSLASSRDYALFLYHIIKTVPKLHVCRSKKNNNRLSNTGCKSSIWWHPLQFGVWWYVGVFECVCVCVCVCECVMKGRGHLGVYVCMSYIYCIIVGHICHCCSCLAWCLLSREAYFADLTCSQLEQLSSLSSESNPLLLFWVIKHMLNLK